MLVDFWAEWCGPCRKVAPVLEEIATELGDKLEIVKLDIDANPRDHQAYQVMSVPTLTLFKGGEPVQSIVGASPKSDLLRMIEGALSVGTCCQRPVPARGTDARWRALRHLDVLLPVRSTISSRGARPDAGRPVPIEPLPARGSGAGRYAPVVPPVTALRRNRHAQVVPADWR